MGADWLNETHKFSNGVMRTNKVDVSKLVLLPVPEGYTVRIKHYYTLGEEGYNGPKKLHMTTAALLNPQGEVVREADALVNPKDTPIKKLGRAIAHNRLIIDYNKAQNAT